MEQPQKNVVCTEDTQTFTIELPCRLAERIEKFADDHATEITNVVIEALDAFLGAR